MDKVALQPPATPTPVPYWKDENIKCGVGIFSTNKNDPFHAECVGHDVGYLHGGDSYQRASTDKAFFILISKKAAKNPLLIPRAALYIAAVSIFGRFMWREENRTTEEGKRKQFESNGR